MTNTFRRGLAGFLLSAAMTVSVIGVGSAALAAGGPDVQAYYCAETGVTTFAVGAEETPGPYLFVLVVRRGTAGITKPVTANAQGRIAFTERVLTADALDGTWSLLSNGHTQGTAPVENGSFHIVHSCVIPVPAFYDEWTLTPSAPVQVTEATPHLGPGLWCCS